MVVKILTTGTITRPASMQKAPALMGDCSRVGKEERRKMLAIMTTVEKRELAQQAALVVFF